MSRHPIQPLETDTQGVLRFKGNAIVRHLLDSGVCDMNSLAAMPFSQEDREQFAQLIGYSLSGFAELPYVSEDTYAAAEEMSKTGKSDIEARLETTTDMLARLRRDLRIPMAALYGRHPDDFMPASRVRDE